MKRAWALLFAIALETFSLRTAVVESRKVKGDAGWWGFIRHSRSPELPVVLKGDAEAHYEKVMQALAICKKLDITEVGLVTKRAE